MNADESARLELLKRKPEKSINGKQAQNEYENLSNEVKDCL